MHDIRKHITAAIMAFCLLLLTGINFLLYTAAPCEQVMVMAEDVEEVAEEEPFPVPVEEKSPESTGAAPLAEEFLDDNTGLHVYWVNKLYLHKIHEAERLQIIHYELLSPPPEKLT